jgi:hypothetical protein
MSALDALAQDLRYGLRLIRKHPLLSAAMIATLSLGIGLDAGAFTLIDGMLFRARVKDSPSTFVQIDSRDSAPGAARTQRTLSTVANVAKPANRYESLAHVDRNLTAGRPLRRLIGARAGAPPVRGKGVTSHPSGSIGIEPSSGLP